MCNFCFILYNFYVIYAILLRFRGKKVTNKKESSLFSLHQAKDDFFHEKERVFNRWVLVAVFSVLFVFSFSNHSVFINSIAFSIIVSYLFLNTIQFSFIKDKDARFIYLKNFFLYCDCAVTLAAIMLAPDVLAFFVPLLLFLVIGIGIRYGYKLMIRATVFTILLFTIGVIFVDYWKDNLFITLSFYVMMILIPPYLKQLIFKIEKINSELLELATIDSLTGINNRRSLLKQLEEINSRSKRMQRPFVILYFDLDNFKKVNDTRGHKEGDSLLVEIAYNLKHSFRNEDYLFRLGGDEFVVITEMTDNEESARKVASKIINAVEAAKNKICPEIAVSCSIGIVLAKPFEKEVDIKMLIQFADEAMYNAKNNGKNTISFSNSF